jgi:CheY-like chemotaxis protein
MDAPPRTDSSAVILIAEDEASVREMVALILRTAGHRPIPCADGEEAIAALTSEPHIDLALLDLRMPRIDGLHVIRAIRAHPLWQRLRVLVMSAYSDEVQAEEVLAAGADAFLPKPFTVPDLTSAITRELNAARAADSAL